MLSCCVPKIAPEKVPKALNQALVVQAAEKVVPVATQKYLIAVPKCVRAWPRVFPQGKKAPILASVLWAARPTSPHDLRLMLPYTFASTSTWLMVPAT